MMTAAMAAVMADVEAMVKAAVMCDSSDRGGKKDRTLASLTVTAAMRLVTAV